MHRSTLALPVLLLATPAYAQNTTPPADAAKQERMEREISELRSRLESLEAELSRTRTQPPPATAYAPPPPPPAAPKPASDHSLELYGFAQVDVVQDFNRVDPSWDATLRPSKIPTT